MRILVPQGVEEEVSLPGRPLVIEYVGYECLQQIQLLLQLYVVEQKSVVYGIPVGGRIVLLLIIVGQRELYRAIPGVNLLCLFI